MPAKIEWYTVVHGSVPDPWHFGTDYGSGSSDPYLWLTDPAADPDTDSDLYQNLQWLVGCEKSIFSYFFTVLINEIEKLPNFKNIFCILFCNHYFSSSVLVTNGSGCGSRMPKNIWILRIRTLVNRGPETTDTSRVRNGGILWRYRISQEGYYYRC